MQCRLPQAPCLHSEKHILDGLCQPSRAGRTRPVRLTSLSSSKYIAQSARSGGFKAVSILPSWDVETFRAQAFVPKLPALLLQDVSKQPPAYQSWLQRSGKEQVARSLRHDYLNSHGDVFVPLELTRKDDAGTERFERFNAPLKLFLDWMQQREAEANSSSGASSSPHLYLAQCRISDLPSSLRADLPTPDLVLKAGKGDIYDANIWIGTPPTYTPLHRDPNPNFFLQLAGTKVVRLLPPNLGSEIFRTVQAKLGKDGNAAFRGEEMMQGEERAILEKEVWPDERSAKSPPGFEGDGYEATVEEGRALFIPLGWWHSIKSVGTGANASVNWWFR